MRVPYYLILILLVVACTIAVIKTVDEKITIITSNISLGEEVNGDAKKHEPVINIIIPKNMETINSSRVVVRLNVSNFKLVTPDRYPKIGQGHVQVWVDDMEFRGSRTEFVFENESNGTHIIKAELMMSNNTVLPYSKTIKVIINKT